MFFVTDSATDFSITLAPKELRGGEKKGNLVHSKALVYKYEAPGLQAMFLSSMNIEKTPTQPFLR